MNTLIWVVALLLVGLGVMVLEVFVPSGGILGFVSVLALVAAVATAFLEQGVAAGMASLAVVVLAVPAVLAVAFRWFPETPLGRRVMPPAPEPADVLPDPGRRSHLRDLVGQAGTTVSELLPWGRVEIAGEAIDAMSEGGPIPAGVAVEAVGVQGTALIVRFVEQRPKAEPVRPEVPERPVAADSALSEALETFDFDGFDQPAA